MVVSARTMAGWRLSVVICMSASLPDRIDAGRSCGGIMEGHGACVMCSRDSWEFWERTGRKKWERMRCQEEETVQSWMMRAWKISCGGRDVTSGGGVMAG